MKLLKAIQERWSPRSFKDFDVTSEQLALLFEAARWAPSSNNEQEWSYYYAHRTSAPEAHALLCGCLTPGNQLWAPFAPVIMVSVGRHNFHYNDKPNRHWMHDVGAASVSLALQATSMGLQLHQMAGFDVSRCAGVLGLGPDEEPVAMMVLGYPDSADKLPPALKERELAPRVRREVSEFAYDFSKTSRER